MKTPKYGSLKFKEGKDEEQERDEQEQEENDDSTAPLGPKKIEPQDPAQAESIEDITRPPSERTGWGQFGVAQRIGFSPERPPRDFPTENVQDSEEAQEVDEDATPKLSGKGYVETPLVIETEDATGNLGPKTDHGQFEFPAVTATSLPDSIDRDTTPPSSPTRKLEISNDPLSITPLQKGLKRREDVNLKQRAEDTGEPTHEDDTHESLGSGSSNNLAQSLNILKGVSVSSDNFDAIGVGSSSYSIETAQASDSTMTQDDLPAAEHISYASRMAVKRLRFYDEVQQEFDQLELVSEEHESEGVPFDFNVFKPLQIKKSEEELIGDETEDELYKTESKAELLKRIEEYMVGRRFRVGGETLLVDRAISKHGGLSYGFIARYENDTVSPEKPQRRAFVKCIDFTLHFDEHDDEELDLVRDSQYKELANNKLAAEAIPGFAPNVIAVLAFTKDEDGNDIPLHLNSYSVGEEGGDISSYFFEIDNQNGQVVFSEFHVPNKFITITEFKGEDGADFTTAIEKNINIPKTKDIVFTPELQALAQSLLLEMYVEQEDAQSELERIAEIYNYSDTVSKYMFVARFWLKILDVMKDELGAEQEALIRHELTQVYEKTEEKRDQVLDAIDPVVSLFAGQVDELNKKGIIHRDIKPGNILAEKNEDGTLHPVAIDFGLTEKAAQLLDHDLVIEHTQDGLLKECEVFVSQFSDEAAQSFNQELQTFFAENESVNIMDFVGFLRSALRKAERGFDYSYHRRLTQEDIQKFIRQFLYVNTHEPDVEKLQHNEYLCNLLSAYEYGMQGKFHAAALSIANPLDYTYKGRTYGTPEFAHPLTYVIASLQFEKQRHEVSKKLFDLLSLQDSMSGSMHPDDRLTQEDVAFLIEEINEKVQRGETDEHGANFELELNRLQRLYDNYSDETLVRTQMYPGQLDGLIAHYLHQYHEIRTIDKLAAMSHRQQDTYAAILTNGMVSGRVLFNRKESSSRLMSYALKRASHIWYPTIREVHENMENSDGLKFFAPALFDFLDTEAILEGDLDEYMQHMDESPYCTEAYEEQQELDRQKSGRDLLLQNNMMAALESQTRMLYADLAAFDLKRNKLREEAVRLNRELNDMQNDDPNREAKAKEAEEARLKWEENSHLEEDFYRDRISTFKRIMLERFDALRELYSI